MSKKPSKLREQKRKSQDGYDDAINSGKIKPEIMHKCPDGIIPCKSESRAMPYFSFL